MDHESKGEDSSMRTAQSCKRGDCSRVVVTTFCQEPLCLDHFCSSCYEFLNGIDQRERSLSTSRLEAPEQSRTADECARRVLDICVSGTLLSNLERARLLDILLWCGDVASFSQRKRLAARSARGNTANDVAREKTLDNREAPF